VSSLYRELHIEQSITSDERNLPLWSEVIRLSSCVRRIKILNLKDGLDPIRRRKRNWKQDELMETWLQTDRRKL
jgi:3'-phosphoadenosine 5'-phosphosulfate sulfotransferase